MSLVVTEAVGSEELGTIRSIVECGMGPWQAYYATTCVEQGYCRAILAFENGEPAGVALFYKLDLQPRASVGVIYYVVVEERFRRRGIGRVLVASVEHLLEEERVDAIIATTRFDNAGSRKLFGDLGYVELPLEVVEDRCGEVITRLTCSYEDDLLLFKGLTVDLEELVEILSIPQSSRNVEEVQLRGSCALIFAEEGGRVEVPSEVLSIPELPPETPPQVAIAVALYVLSRSLKTSGSPP